MMKYQASQVKATIFVLSVLIFLLLYSSCLLAVDLSASDSKSVEQVSILASSRNPVPLISSANSGEPRTQVDELVIHHQPQSEAANEAISNLPESLSLADSESEDEEEEEKKNETTKGNTSDNQLSNSTTKETARRHAQLAEATAEAQVAGQLVSSAGAQNWATQNSNSNYNYNSLAPISDRQKSLAAFESNQEAKKLASKLNAELCRNFSIGFQNDSGGWFMSPNYPNPYPVNLNCTRLIQAPKGHTIKLEFRDQFNIEEAGNDCDNDKIEIRDGRYGYSPVLARYCGSKFPAEVMSTNEAMLLRFISDFSISHTGFKAVYTFVRQQNSKPSPPFECRFNVPRQIPQEMLLANSTVANSQTSPTITATTIANTGGNTNATYANSSIDSSSIASIYSGIIKNSDVPEKLLDYTKEYNTSLECIWNITVMPGWKIYLTFSSYELSKPNDCESNFIEIYENELNEEDQTVKFCGTRTEPQQSKSNVFNIRHHASPLALGSRFEIVYTAFRDKGSEGCDALREFDCDDGTCIHESLKCDGQVNCKYRYDEASEPGPCTGSETEGYFFEAEHMVSILIIFLGLVTGMCASIYFSCAGKIRERRQRDLEYHERKSREASMDGQLNKLNCSASTSAHDLAKPPAGATIVVDVGPQQSTLLENHIGYGTAGNQRAQKTLYTIENLQASQHPALRHRAATAADTMRQNTILNMHQQQQQPANMANVLNPHMISDSMYNSRSLIASNASLDASKTPQHHPQQQQQLNQAYGFLSSKNNNKIYDINALIHHAGSRSSLHHHPQQQQQQQQQQFIKQQIYHDSVGSGANNTTTDSANTQTSQLYGNPLLGCGINQASSSIDNHQAAVMQQSGANIPTGPTMMHFGDHAASTQTMPVNLAKYNNFIRSQQQQRQHQLMAQNAFYPGYHHEPGSLQYQGSATRRPNALVYKTHLTGDVMDEQNRNLNGVFSSSLTCCNALDLSGETPLVDNLNVLARQHQRQASFYPTGRCQQGPMSKLDNLQDLRAATIAGARVASTSSGMPRSTSAHQLSRSPMPQSRLVRSNQQQQQYQMTMAAATAAQKKSMSDAGHAMAAKQAHSMPNHSLSYPHACTGSCHLEAENEADSPILPPPPLPPSQLHQVAESRRAAFKGAVELTSDTIPDSELMSACVGPGFSNISQMDALTSTDSEPTIGMLVNRNPLRSLARLQHSFSGSGNTSNARHHTITRTLHQPQPRSLPQFERIFGATFGARQQDQHQQHQQMMLARQQHQFYTTQASSSHEYNDSEEYPLRSLQRPGQLRHHSSEITDDDVDLEVDGEDGDDFDEQNDLELAGPVIDDDPSGSEQPITQDQVKQIMTCSRQPLNVNKLGDQYRT